MSEEGILPFHLMLLALHDFFVKHGTLPPFLTGNSEHRSGGLGMESMRYSYSTAVSLFKCIIGFVLVTGSNWVAKRMGQNNMYT